MMWKARVNAICDRAHGTGLTEAIATRSLTVPLMPCCPPRAPSSNAVLVQHLRAAGARTSPPTGYSHQAELLAASYGVVAARDRQLLQDPAHVGAHRVDGDEQVGRDLLGRQE